MNVLVKKEIKAKSTVAVRSMLVVSGLISLVLGYLLWNNIWTLEQIIAIILFIAGLFKLLMGLFR